jgi:hypothetical protein
VIPRAPSSTRIVSKAPVFVPRDSNDVETDRVLRTASVARPRSAQRSIRVCASSMRKTSAFALKPGPACHPACWAPSAVPVKGATAPVSASTIAPSISNAATTPVSLTTPAVMAYAKGWSIAPASHSSSASAPSQTTCASGPVDSGPRAVCARNALAVVPCPRVSVSTSARQVFATAAPACRNPEAAVQTRPVALRASAYASTVRRA